MKFLVRCKYCNQELSRTNFYVAAVCFDCKKRKKFEWNEAHKVIKNHSLQSNHAKGI